MLASGSKLGPYSILARIGAGGMGVVYRARDARLGRDVALKVLPDSFAADPQRMMRFHREAQVLASLNHANIASIYGVEEAPADASLPPVPGAQAKSLCHFALVMELVEGPTLADRIAQGSAGIASLSSATGGLRVNKMPAIPFEEVLPVAQQVAQALEYAHDKGIIHRDLKPANIKITADGQVKLLDFGLAKALADDPSSTPDLSNSPTLSMAATQAGFILGTAAYMAPEQAKGKTADRRADIWAFGCVLYEMLTGQRAFPGEDTSETLAAIIRGEPDWNALPPATPHLIRNLLRRCLEKNTKRRLQAIGEARVAIEDCIANPEAPATVADATLAGASRITGLLRRARLAWGLAMVATLAAFALGLAYFRRPVDEPRVIRAAIPGPPNAIFDFSNSPTAGPVEISPDGRWLVLAAHIKGGPQMLWLQPIDRADAQVMPGTEGGAFPFWSPDSRQIGFFADGRLKKVAIHGGPPVTVCEAPEGRGGAWNRGGVIVFSSSAFVGLSRVSESGGTPQPITQLDRERGESTHRWPHFLPDGRHFVYLSRIGTGGGGLIQEGTRIVVGTLDGASSKPLLPIASNATYASGYILYARENALMAHPFDADRLEFTGDPVPVVEDLSYDSSFSRGIFSVSQNGLLLYQPGNITAGTQLIWFDRSGKALGVLGEGIVHLDIMISPDGTKVAAGIVDPRSGPPDIWVYDVNRRTRTRHTFDPGPDNQPVWAPDSTRLTFRSLRKGGGDIYVKSIAGAAPEEPLLESLLAKFPTSWSPDGRFIAYEVRGLPKTKSDIWILPLEGDRQPKPFLETPFREGFAQFSPDGRWLAYASDESGRWEIYVTPFPGPGRKWQVSTNGGEQPRWRRDGREIFYFSADGQITAVPVPGRGATFELGKPRPLFAVRPLRRGNMYDVSGDGQKFVVNTIVEQEGFQSITLVVNWVGKLPKKK